MKQCETIMKYCKAFQPVIDRLHIISRALTDSGKISFADMAARKGDLHTRFVSTASGCSFNIISVQKNINFEYGLFKENSNLYSNYVQTTYGRTQVQMKIGEVTSFSVMEHDKLSSMQYPINEEQYFQFLTIRDLAPEYVYDYFFSKEVEFNTYMYCTYNNEDDFNEIAELDFSENVKDLELIIATYCITNGIKL